ncbi:MAG: hypothetical protein ACR2HD_04570 [Solirubrobacteraceae bacterium]|nr:MAG: hypothetical protein DLM63_08830 [Solirubrobacterales bacterium]
MNTPDPRRLDELTERLEAAAQRLRTGELGVEEAGALVEECAQLASAAAAELDRLARAPLDGVAPGQGELL